MVQVPNGRKAFWSFEIEIWNLFGIWNLAFGISTLFGSGYAGLGRWYERGMSTFLASPGSPEECGK